jgi:hypothetical protein
MGVVPLAGGERGSILVPIKDLNTIFLRGVAIRYNRNGIIIKPILLSYRKLAKQFAIGSKLVFPVLYCCGNSLVTIFQGGLINTMLSQEDCGTREPAQDALYKLIFTRLIPTIFALVLRDKNLFIISLLNDGVQTLCREGYSDAT